MQTSHFYIHIPFCRQKCPYCKFALTPIFDDTKKRRYLAYLNHEIGDYFENFRISSSSHPPITLYFGGGTPSILTLEEVGDILGVFPDDLHFSEITFECNPEDITETYVRGLIHLGINRISLGVQTLNNDSLAEIHRSNRENILSAIEIIDTLFLSSRRDLSENLSFNIDFILGLPYVNSGEILENIQELHTKFPSISHTSVYMLEDEKYPKHWKTYSISEIELQVEFCSIMDYFETLGWNHYELSNFAKPGLESLHNQSYWNHSNYRGFGLSASSFENGRRFANASSFARYYSSKKEDEENLTVEQVEIEKIMFGLRTGGIDFDVFPSGKVHNLIEEGFLEIKNSKILPTKTGIFLLDYIMSELV